MINVVPSEVEQRAAPAAKHDKRDASERGERTKENAMGSDMPVKATIRERGRLDNRGFKELLSPPEISENPEFRDVER